MEPAHLDWSSAEVRDATLTVKVGGDPEDEWEETFTRTLALLSSDSGWGRAHYKKRTVTVEDVEESDTESLRFALDGAVQEANAHHAGGADEDDEDDGARDSGDDQAGDDADRRMTEQFRGE